MTPQTQSAQPTQPKTTKLNPNFNHRVSLSGEEVDADAFHVAEAVDRLADQVQSILVMLEDQFIDPDANKLADHIIYNALEAVMGLVLDMKAICQAHHKATRQAPKEGVK